MKNDNDLLAYFRDHLAGACAFLVAFIETHKFQPLLLPDHIGYKCSSHDEYLAIKEYLKLGNVTVDESMVSGRMISLIRLSPSWLWFIGGSKLEYLELQDQKPDGSQKSGFDHYEVIPRNGRTVEMVVAILATKGITTTIDEKPHHTTWIIAVPNAESGDPKIKIAREPLYKKIERAKGT